MICGAFTVWANQNSGHFEDFLFLPFSIANVANILIRVAFDDCYDEFAAKLPG